MNTSLSDTARQSSPAPLLRIEFIALIAALMALNALAIDVMLPALPMMGEALGVANENDRPLVLSAYMLGFGLTQLVFGPLADRYGRRGPLLVGLIIYVVAAFCAILAPNFTTLLILRAVQGMGAAGTRVIGQSVVRDLYHGRAMAEIMSLVFMVIMVIPIIAPFIGQTLLLIGPWQVIFVFMAGLAAAVTIWAFFRLPETLAPENKRELRPSIILEGFMIVLAQKSALLYTLAGVFTFGALLGYVNTSQQVFVEIYELGPLFPVAFGSVGVTLAFSAFSNSKVVGRFGMRRISHFAMLVFTSLGGVWWILSLMGPVPLPVTMVLLATIMFMFGWGASNMGVLAMEPLGKVAGTASSVFGFVQTMGGAIIGLLISRAFDGTVTAVAGGYFFMGICALICILLAENGKLFGVGAEYSHQTKLARDL